MSGATQSNVLMYVCIFLNIIVVQESTFLLDRDRFGSCGLQGNKSKKCQRSKQFNTSKGDCHQIQS